MILKVRIIVTSKEEENSIKIRAMGTFEFVHNVLCLLDLRAYAECI